MKKVYIALVAVALGSSLFFTQCKKPSENFDFSINADVFDNTVAVKLYDAATPGIAPKNITLTIEGKSANGIYEISGRKEFKVVDGIISLGVHPSIAPTEGSPVEFVINVTAPGYLKVRMPVTVLLGQETKMVAISMINIENPPLGVTVVTETVALTGGATTTPVAIATPAAAPGEPSAAVAIAPGTSFKDNAGNTISGASLNATMVHFNTQHAGSLNAFPGSGFNSNDIKDPNGNTVSGMFQTAGFTSIEMDMGGTAVKQFSQPVDVAIGIDASQTNPSTGAAFAVGDIIPIWSYQVETGKWIYEKQGTVSNNGGKLEVAFNTTHLTYYNLAFLQSTCAQATVNFNTGLASSETFLVDIFAGNETVIPAISGYVVQVANNATASFENVPTGNVTMKVYRNIAENSQTDWSIRTAPVGTFTGTLCGDVATVQLVVPVSNPIAFNIEGKCKNNAVNPVVRPSVDIWYRLAGANTEYSMLGHVSQGLFQTTNLNFMSTYDFKVIWDGSTVFLKTKQIDSMNYQRTIEVPAAYEKYFCK